ncbi:hypothetical protein BOTCAL_0602g00030 [Botryotinia calthae]|uniref:F-box domain-containing protein n=1 Tax=Botryotinia calthae TaxID=38488 RepID=A0A4Y8CIS7_9HELO|nr:hypothetical protein BOTCAL_0602g00030 [Botryotinia calthae]
MNPFRNLLLLFRKPQELFSSHQRPDVLSSSVLKYIPVEIQKPREPAPSPRRPDALSSSILKDVPVEILLHIMSYLPIESAVVFSISCLHLKTRLGSRYFLEVASSTEHTLALLNLIVLDLPDCVACPACNRLHNMENLLRYCSTTYNSGSTTRQYDALPFPACVSYDRDRSSRMVSILFGSTAVKMALKRAHQNPECTELLTMMSSPRTRTTHWGKYVRQCREECRIVQGHLMHRIQSVFISRRREKLTAFRRPFDPAEDICTHIESEGQCFLNTIGSGVMGCRKCPTEYRADVMYCEGLGWGRFFTKWVDLGSELEGDLWSQHLPPTEAQQTRRFRDLLRGRVSVRTDKAPQDKIEVPPKAGELLSAFEGSRDYKFDSLLTPENKALFLRYRELYCRNGNNSR